MGPATLPLEIFSSSLDHLDFWDLLRTAHVCRSWRAAAQNHATYWRRIGLHSASPPAVNCFLARFTSQSRRPVALDIRLVDAAEPDRVRFVQTVLPQIRGNLYRLECASIQAPRELAQSIIARLDRQAPRLQYLALTVTLRSRDTAVELPPTLFNGQCPQLRSLVLANVTLPNTWVQALDQVDCIQYHHPPKRIVAFPIAPFLKAASNPPLRSLELLAEDFVLPDEFWSSKAQAAFRRLQSITISCSSPNSAVVSTLPLQDIPDVILSPPDFAAGRIVMTHIGDGDLSLHVEPKSRSIADTSVVYTSANTDASNIRRIFCERLEDFFDTRAHLNPIHFYFDGTYAGRVSNLTASSSRWCIFAKGSLVFEKCRSLTLVLDDIEALQSEDPPGAADRLPSFPALTSLTLTLGDSSSPSEVWRDLALRVDGPLSSCRLILHNLSVDMLNGDWIERFKTVHMHGA